MTLYKPATAYSDSIVRPQCSECGTTMLLARIEPDKPDHDRAHVSMCEVRALSQRNRKVQVASRPPPWRQGLLQTCAHLHRRCSQSHCSGCSRTQPSTTLVIACVVAWMSILPSGPRTGAISSVSSARK